MNYVLAPSMLAADFKCLGQQLRMTEENGAKYLHFDVMDGIFVPSISFGMPVLQSIQGTTSQVMDVHLMITEPIRYVKEFKEAGAHILTIHYEACEDVEKTIEEIKKQGMKAGISIKPNTPVQTIENLLEKVDMVLIMSVEPGFGGQKFIESSLEKIRETRRMAKEKGLELDIQVDGGIYLSNVREVLEAGANIIVAGSAVFKGDPAKNTKEFMEILDEYR